MKKQNYEKNVPLRINYKMTNDTKQAIPSKIQHFMDLLELTYRRIKSLDLYIITSPLVTTQSNWFAGCCPQASTTHWHTTPGSKSRWLAQVRNNKFLKHNVLFDLM